MSRSLHRRFSHNKSSGATVGEGHGNLDLMNVSCPSQSNPSESACLSDIYISNLETYILHTGVFVAASQCEDEVPITCL